MIRNNNREDVYLYNDLTSGGKYRLGAACRLRISGTDVNAINITDTQFTLLPDPSNSPLVVVDHGMTVYFRNCEFFLYSQAQLLEYFELGAGSYVIALESENTFVRAPPVASAVQRFETATVGSVSLNGSVDASLGAMIGEKFHTISIKATIHTLERGETRMENGMYTAQTGRFELNPLSLIHFVYDGGLKEQVHCLMETIVEGKLSYDRDNSHRHTSVSIQPDTIFQTIDGAMIKTEGTEIDGTETGGTETMGQTDGIETGAVVVAGTAEIEIETTVVVGTIVVADTVETGTAAVGVGTIDETIGEEEMIEEEEIESGTVAGTDEDI
eukprot:gene20129-1041_t